MRLVINLATRGRPELLIETLERTLPNIKHPDTLLMVSLDNDDEATGLGIQQHWPNELPRGLFFDNRLREDSFGAKYNRMLEHPADAYLAMVDYAPHVTPGFDEKILEAAQSFPDGIGVVMNQWANLMFPGINAATRRFCELQGYFYPPYFPYWFVDHWFGDIAEMTGRIALADVQIDVGKRPGTQNKRDIDYWTQFFNRTSPLREGIAERIIRADEFQGPGWHKDLLIRNFPLRRRRSEMVNNNAFLQSAPQGDLVGDSPAHQRLRAQGDRIVAELGQTPITRRVLQQVRHPLGVCLLTPTLRMEYTAEYHQSLKQLMVALSEHGIPFQCIEVMGDPFVDKARNKLVKWALETPCDNLFYIDDDIGFPPEKVIEFLERPEPIIAGIYRKKQAEIDFPVDLETDEHNELVEKDGLVKATMVPTGFLRIKRSVIERMLKRYDDTFDEPRLDGTGYDSFPALFLHGIGPNGLWWSEDAAFSKRLEGMGIDMWVDPDVELTHRGSTAFTTRLREHLDQFRETARQPQEIQAPKGILPRQKWGNADPRRRDIKVGGSIAKTE